MKDEDKIIKIGKYRKGFKDANLTKLQSIPPEPKQ